MIRLRRSDFILWEYPKRRMWRELHIALQHPRNHLLSPESKLQDPMYIYWWMKRARNARGIYALGERCPFLAWFMMTGFLQEMIETNRWEGPKAQWVLRKIKKTTSSEKRKMIDLFRDGLSRKEEKHEQHA